MIGRYGGGQDCDRCSKTVGIADYFCRWCGRRLRPDRADRRAPWGVTD